MIIANHVGLKDQGFDSDYNEIDIIWKDHQLPVKRARKSELARKIINQITINLKNTQNNVTYIRSQ